MTLDMPQPRGALTPNRPLADLTWLRVGGPADWLFQPADHDDRERLGDEDATTGEAQRHRHEREDEPSGHLDARDDEQRRATERDSQTNAANERMSQTEQARREQEQQERLAREAQARQLAERQRQQQRAVRQPPPLDRRTPTNALDRGR